MPARLSILFFGSQLQLPLQEGRASSAPNFCHGRCSLPVRRNAHPMFANRLYTELQQSAILINTPPSAVTVRCRARQVAGGGARPPQQRRMGHGQCPPTRPWRLCRPAAMEGLAIAPRRWGSGKEHADVRPADVRPAGDEAPRPPRHADAAAVTRTSCAGAPACARCSPKSKSEIGKNPTKSSDQLYPCPCTNLSDMFIAK